MKTTYVFGYYYKNILLFKTYKMYNNYLFNKTYKKLEGDDIILKLIKPNLSNQTGSALLYSIIIFAVVFILTLSILSLFSTNLLQAKHQEDNMEAYYLSYSGAMMGFAAITQDNNDLLEKIQNNKNGKTHYKEEKVELGQGTVDIAAKQSTVDPHKGWIEITADSVITSQKSSAKSVLYVDPNNTNNIKWKAF